MIDRLSRQITQRPWPRAIGVIAMLATALLGTSSEQYRASAIQSDAAKIDELTPTLGRALFRRVWVPAPSSTRANDGLGPLFNGRSCAQCHAAANAGRVVLDDHGYLLDRGAVVRLSTASGHGDPVYGAQIQTRAVPGLDAEASVKIEWQEQIFKFPDGEQVPLRRPLVHLEKMAFGDLAPGVAATLVVAPSLAIAARIADIKATPPGASFGLKGTVARLEDMTSLAFLRDLGLSTEQNQNPAGDCTPLQTVCTTAMHGAEPGQPEIAPAITLAISEYLKSLPLPELRAIGEPRGSALFAQLGCASCHTATLPGKNGNAVSIYSDLQRHAMGAPLAGVAEVGAEARDLWRTAPLLDIADRLQQGATLLHDGRARTATEAILWHGGAAELSRNNYIKLSKEDRNALERYVLNR